MSHLRYLLTLGFVSAAFFLVGANGAAADVPDVHFAIFRLDFQTYAIKGVYEGVQPYRKSLPPPGYHTQQVGDLYFQEYPPGDFGYTTITSRLTGQLWVYAQTIWLGQGKLIDPPDSSFGQNYEHGHLASDPKTIVYHASGWWSGQDSGPAWAAVKDTDVIERLAALGDYEVVIYDHFYRVGLSDPTTAEWFVIAFTNPPAPRDVGIEGVLWPQQLVTRNVATPLEIVLHNFSAVPEFPFLNGRVENGSGVVYDQSIPAGEIPADSSVTLNLPSWTASALESHTLTLSIRDGQGSPWTDAFADNDQYVRTIGVTALPVFRLRLPSLAPGKSPGGIPLDLDGDGDIDFFHIAYDPKVYRNDLGQGFSDITSRFPPFSHWAREAIASDVDGDGHPELLVDDIYTGPPVLLSSGGSNVYTDITSPAGLGGLEGYGLGRFMDVDQDGDQDLLLVHGYGGSDQEKVVLFENEGGHFARAQNSGLEAHTSTTEEIVPGDLDQDGHPDLILVDWGSPSEVFRNDGSGHFSVVAGPWAAVTLGRSAVAFDPDLDGDLDILLLARDVSASSRFFRNDGDLNFVDATDEFGDLAPAFMAGVGDLDGNGYPDVALGDIEDNKLVLLNEGGHFTKHSELIIQGMLDDRIDVLDIDRDGDLDICNRWYGQYFENMGLDPARQIVGVHLTRLSARRDGTRAVVQWGLADDANASDFRVYRSIASVPEKHSVSGIITGGRRAFEFVDEDAPLERTDYWLAEVSRTGGLNWFGPVSLAAAGLNRLSLSQNRPNPFILATRIAFSLPERMAVRLSIYNVEGRKVRDLADQVFPEGETAVFWDGRDEQGKATSSGIYYYRLDAGNRSFTHRMIKIH